MIAVLATVEEWAFQAHVKVIEAMGFSPGLRGYNNPEIALE
jgi:hypothetical protein